MDLSTNPPLRSTTRGRTGISTWPACTSPLIGEASLQRCAAFIVDSRRQFALDLEQPWRHLVVAFPAHWLDSRLARAELASGARPAAPPSVGLGTSPIITGWPTCCQRTPRRSSRDTRLNSWRTRSTRAGIPCRYRRSRHALRYSRALAG